MSWFRNWFGTRYYSLLYGHRDAQDAQQWVDLLLDRWGLRPGDRVLDMACGRGRHAQWFVERGMQVTGIDIDANSIEEARSAFPGVTFMEHDMRAPLQRGGMRCGVLPVHQFGLFRRSAG